MKVASKMNPESKRLLKEIWAEDKAAYTAMPLQLISSKWLGESCDLPVDAKDNPTWHRIFQVTPSKVHWWLRRVKGRFDAQIAQALAQGKVPNVRNYGSNYRDSDPHLVWKMSCLWTTLHDEVRKTKSAGRCEELELMFTRGALDRDLKDKVTIMDPTFISTEVRFVGDAEGPSESSGVQGSSLDEANSQKQFADLKVFAAELKADSTRFKQHNMQRKAFEDSARADVTSQRERAHDRRLEVVQKEVSSLYVTRACGADTKVSFADQPLQRLSDKPPAVPRDSVLRINFFCLEKLGLEHSKSVAEVATNNNNNYNK